jgi:hypothetical protein
MKCPHKSCALSNDCAIIDITGKTPESFNACSYSRTAAQIERLAHKKSAMIDLKDIKKFKRQRERKEVVTAD